MTSTKTSLRKGRSAAAVHGFKALPDEGAGIFEAIVSVFSNIDYQGDRIQPGAFTDSLERWKASGDPIPVIWSHQWQDLDAHVGRVLDAREVLPGDPVLDGTGIEDLGGLWAKFSLDIGEPFARRLATLLEERRVREFSFAYDVFDEHRGTDGANDLTELDMLELGPTLKGANPATRLLAEGVDAGRTTKARVTVSFDGAVEADIEALYAAGLDWARDLDVGAGGFYALYQEASYPAEQRAVVLVEGWDDPPGDGVFYELTYGDADGILAVTDAAEIEVSVELARKAWKQRAGLARMTAYKAGATVDAPQAGQPGGNREDPDGGNREDPQTRTDAEARDGRAVTAAGLELLGLDED